MNSFLFVKNGTKSSKVFLKDIHYVEAVKKYVRIVTATRHLLIEIPLQYLQRKLPEDIFCRIHRSFIISILHLSEFEVTSATVSGAKLPIGKSYRNALSEKLVVLKDVEFREVYLSENGVNKLIATL